MGDDGSGIEMVARREDGRVMACILLMVLGGVHLVVAAWVGGICFQITQKPDFDAELFLFAVPFFVGLVGGILGFGIGFLWAGIGLWKGVERRAKFGQTLAKNHAILAAFFMVMGGMAGSMERDGSWEWVGIICVIFGTQIVADLVVVKLIGNVVRGRALTN